MAAKIVKYIHFGEFSLNFGPCLAGIEAQPEIDFRLVFSDLENPLHSKNCFLKRIEKM